MDNAVTEVLRKEKTAWQMARSRIKKYIGVDPQLELIFRSALIGIILLYRINIQPLPRTQISKLQSFYSGFIRRVAKERYSELEHKRVSNYSFIEQFKSLCLY